MFPLRRLPSLHVLLLSLSLAACTEEPIADPSKTGEAVPAGGCADDLEFFRTRVWAPTLAVQCIACHNTEGAASGTRLVLKPSDAPGALEANFATVKALAAEELEGMPLLLLKPSGQHPGGHGGGTVVMQGSARYEDLKRFVDRANRVPGSCDATVEACGQGPEAAEQRRLRLLTRFEYDNTVRDLLYLNTASWGTEFPAEEVVHGFDNNAEARAVGPLLADELLKAAEEAAALAVANLSRFVTCAAGETCAKQFILSFGERAFRRPVTGTEYGRYMTLYKAVAAADGYTAGIQTVMAAMLHSPHFLYRAELGRHLGGGQFALTDYEVASQLSYLFWGSMPDEALFAKARAGQLHTPAQVEVEARRLLASARSRPVLDHFMSQWLELDRLGQAEKDPAAFPDFTASVRTAMRAETTELFAYVVRQGSGRLPELFSSNYSFLTEELARFYGLPSQSTATTGVQRWELRSSGRGGLLTHGSILASQATPQASSPVRRGKLVRERLLCQPLAPPPSGVEVQLPPVDPASTNRERYREHSQNAACASCHHLMDPIGFGFEQFDSVGRYVPTQAGQTVDASGQVLDSLSTDGTFFGVDGLQRMLAESPDVHGCFSRQWMRFAYGVAEEEVSCEARALTERFRTGGLSIPGLLVSLTQVPAFIGRRGDASTIAEPLPGSPAAEPLLVQVKPQSSWTTGYCDTVEVTNAGTRELEWFVPLKIAGTLKDVWTAQATPQAGGNILFSGLSYNRRIAPGATLSFGYCASR